MLTHLTGIVLQQTRYSESSLILKIYTLESGLLSFIVKGFSKKKSQHRALYAPLNILDIQVNFKAGSGIQHMREVSCRYPFRSLHTDIPKMASVLFINEVILKSIHEEEANPAAWNFIVDSLLYFDRHTENQADFHLYFCSRFCRYLGFGPSGSYKIETPEFDMKNGMFVAASQAQEGIMKFPYSYYFSILTQTELDQYEMKVRGEHRSAFLDQLLQYYQYHLGNYFRLISPEVLQAVFSPLK